MQPTLEDQERHLLVKVIDRVLYKLDELVLFHPARKVREVYWKIYNSLYIGSQDSLVAAYPILEDEENNIFSRPELMMFV
ncbi:hypothetical protein ZOSMA_312G00070 [Zostera marina]|uniref:Uncharacterized protein n=1 Tax=Zostera marina TaxID=29655 RepID=A0A0K9P9P8_ZOSMR|nr:hypothetical protein ZOSMA_312G00070 [Zostera marina]